MHESIIVSRLLNISQHSLVQTFYLLIDKWLLRPAGLFLLKFYKFWPPPPPGARVQIIWDSSDPPLLWNEFCCKHQIIKVGVRRVRWVSDEVSNFKMKLRATGTQLTVKPCGPNLFREMLTSKLDWLLK